MARKSALSRLKRFVRTLVRPPARYTYDPSHTVIADYSEYSRLSVAEIERRINGYKQLTREEWEGVPGEGFEAKARTFYGDSRYYICDILSGNPSKQAVVDNMNRFTPLILDSIRNHPGRRFLEFGGGTGVFCDIVAGMGKDVTYLDIPGQQFEFAKWRFAKYGLPVRMIQTTPGRLEIDGEYDIVFTDAVMEHLADPITPTRILASRLAKGGIFIMLVDLSGEDHDMPMHKDVDIAALHQALAESGLANLHGRGTFCSIWSKP